MRFLYCLPLKMFYNLFAKVLTLDYDKQGIIYEIEYHQPWLVNVL